ncbi:TonB-dependent receptor, partial [Pelomonas sp. HMWF004]
MGAEQRRMRVARDVFATTTLAGMVACAYAQGVPAPAGAASAPQAKANTLETVTVTGYRSSLASSAREKRDDVGLSETVFAEDIGKFPDSSIADALSRVPGVRVNRATIDGEGMSISIRGMGANFTRVLLNGAPMASASAGSWGGNISANREVDMDFLPSELFRSATVYKSQRASILEGGIAGTVDMRSVRPFDKQGFRSAFTLSGNYRDQVGKWSDTGSAIVSNTWKTSFGDVGALFGAAWGHTKYKTTGFQTVDMRNFQLKSFQALASDNPNNTGGGSQSTPDTVPSGLALNDLPAFARPILVPGAQINRQMLLDLNPGANIKQIDNALMGRLGRHLSYEGERERASAVASLQWRPNENVDLYLDMMGAEKSNQMVYNAMNAGTRANTPIPIGMEFDRSDCTNGCVLNKATFANTFWSLEFRPMEEKTKFWSFNPGFE